MTHFIEIVGEAVVAGLAGLTLTLLGAIVIVAIKERRP